MNYESKDTPEIRLAPEHKALNPDKLPKRPVDKGVNFLDMTREDLIGFMVDAMSFPFDRLRALQDETYFRKCVMIAISHLHALTRYVMEQDGVNVAKAMCDSNAKYLTNKVK